MEVESKVYAKVAGKVVPESVNLELGSRKDMSLKFQVLAEDGTKKEYKITNSTIICKFGQLHGFSVSKLYEDLGNEVTTAEDTNSWVQRAIEGKNRNIVVLLGEKGEAISLVSEKHKQVPLDSIYRAIKQKAEEQGMRIVKEAKTGESYAVNFEVGRNNMMSFQVAVYLGRNDALGRGSITFSGSGGIFVCSNQIIAYSHRSVAKHSNNASIQPRRLFHVIGVDERIQKQIEECLVNAKEQIFELGKKLEESQKIELSRAMQFKALNLIQEKFKFGDKYLSAVRRKLYSESETLFGLSQSLTYVGTHEVENADIKDKLCKLGGQVVYLGADLVQLLTEIVEKDKVQEKEAVIR